MIFVGLRLSETDLDIFSKAYPRFKIVTGLNLFGSKNRPEP